MALAALGVIPWLPEHSLLKPLLKGQFHRFSTYGFFHESVSSKPLSIPLGPFRFFSKILGDIRSLRLANAKKLQS
jgi:hypothetical protein